MGRHEVEILLPNTAWDPFDVFSVFPDVDGFDQADLRLWYLTVV